MTVPTPPTRPRTFQRALKTMLAPVAVALTVFSWGATDAFAAATDGRNLINNELEDFQDYLTPPGGTVPKVTTTITAKLPDLLLAIAAVIERQRVADPSVVTSSWVADLVAGVLINGELSTETAKIRSDRDKIIAAVIDQAVKSAAAQNSPDWIAEMVAASIQAYPTKPITLTGQAAAIGQALKSGSTADIGVWLAQQPSVQAALQTQTTTANKNKLVATAILNASTGTGANTAGVEKFVFTLINHGDLPLTGTSRTTTAIAIAKLVKKSLPAAGAVIAAAGSNLTGAGLPDPLLPADKTANLAALQLLADTAIKDSSLKVAAAEITASVGALYAQTAGNGTGLPDYSGITAFASSLASTRDAVTKGLIAGGAIKVAADATQATQIFNDIAAQTTGGAVKDFFKFSAAAAAGVTDAAKIEAIVTAGLSKVPVIATDANKIKLGTTIVAAVSLTNPEAAFEVGQTLASAAGPLAIADKNKLAADLAKSAKSALASGQAAAGVASLISDTDVNAKSALAIAANKAAAKYVSNITMEVGGQIATTLLQVDFVKQLTTVNTGKASDIAVGISMADPVNTATFVETVVFLAGGKVRASAAKVAQAIATSVDVERSAEVATILSAKFATVVPSTDLVSLKTSTAAAIATGIAKGINTRPDVKTTNRADEMGEVAASMVGQVLKVVTGTTADKAKLISSITSSIIKVLSKTEQVDTRISGTLTHPTIGLSIGTRTADQTFAAGILGDVLYTLYAATQAAGGSFIDGAALTAIREQLLKDIPKLGANASYKTLLTNVFSEDMSLNASAAKYENGVRLVTEIGSEPNGGPSGATGVTTDRTGSVIDAETDTRNG